jgi:hypothetical protein
MRVVISTIKGNETLYVKEVMQTADPITLIHFVTNDITKAYDFETKARARAYCQIFERTYGKNYHIEGEEEGQRQLYE